MSAQTTFDFKPTPAAGFPPAPSEAHQRAVSEGQGRMVVMNDDEILAAAAGILERRAKMDRVDLSSPAKAGELAKHRLGALEHEVFAVLWLDARNRLIEFEQLFRGTLTQTSVYPREVVKSALAHNAAACILTHNHPSGTMEPSRADEMPTRTLKDALTLVDVRVLDHLIVAGAACLSFAERGLL